MCKYCEEVVQRFNNGIVTFSPYGDIRIIFCPEDVGYLLQVMDKNWTYSVRYCPWYGRRLDESSRSDC